MQFLKSIHKRSRSWDFWSTCKTQGQRLSPRLETWIDKYRVMAYWSWDPEAENHGNQCWYKKTWTLIDELLEAYCGQLSRDIKQEFNNYNASKRIHCQAYIIIKHKTMFPQPKQVYSYMRFSHQNFRMNNLPLHHQLNKLVCSMLLRDIQVYIPKVHIFF